LMMKYIGSGATWNKSETMERLQKFISWYDLGENIGLMIVIRKSDDKPIGHAGLVPQIIEGIQEMEIGYWIKPEFWGQGFAIESAKRCKEIGFNL
jgi:RimJ/RimL family protein N-acetyltransferase